MCHLRTRENITGHRGPILSWTASQRTSHVPPKPAPHKPYGHRAYAKVCPSQSCHAASLAAAMAAPPSIHAGISDVHTCALACHVCVTRSVMPEQPQDSQACGSLGAACTVAVPGMRQALSRLHDSCRQRRRRALPNLVAAGRILRVRQRALARLVACHTQRAQQRRVGLAFVACLAHQLAHCVSLTPSVLRRNLRKECRIAAHVRGRVGKLDHEAVRADLPVVPRRRLLETRQQRHCALQAWDLARRDRRKAAVVERRGERVISQRCVQSPRLEDSNATAQAALGGARPWRHVPRHKECSCRVLEGRRRRGAVVGEVRDERIKRKDHVRRRRQLQLLRF
mmetsp:Transcript_31440/g.93792  ORF Transcript_31440/g.93792 Transcript_31440/m.93792 type:complete len:340 (-) Transcript_31440:725-1744(-)